MWISELEFEQCNTNKDALISAMQMIELWCNVNNCTYEITHNTEVDFDHLTGNAYRCITIKTNDNKCYVYKMIIRNLCETEFYQEYDEALSLLFNEDCYTTKQRITKTYYQCVLKKL